MGGRGLRGLWLSLGMFLIERFALSTHFLNQQLDAAIAPATTKATRCPLPTLPYRLLLAGPDEVTVRGSRRPNRSSCDEANAKQTGRRDASSLCVAMSIISCARLKSIKSSKLIGVGDDPAWLEVSHSPSMTKVSHSPTMTSPEVSMSRRWGKNSSSSGLTSL